MNRVSHAASRSVLVVESDRSAARQIQACLAYAGFTVLPPVLSAREAIASIGVRTPDVLVMDITLVVDDIARRDLRDLTQQHAIPIVYLSSTTDRATLERAADGCAAACILKPFADRQLVSSVLLATIAAERGSTMWMAPKPLTLEEKLRAIAAVVNDLPLSDEPSTSLALARAHQATVAVPNSNGLSAREREVVDLLANGARVVTIARQMQLSPHTVRNHLKSVFRKLNVHGQHELFEYWRGQKAG